MMPLRTPSFRLDGKRALVVGASSGLGQAAAVALGEYGAEVVVAARRMDGLAETVAMIAAVGGKAIAAPLDITHVLDDTRNLAAYISEHGPFDVCLNAVGMARHKAALDTKPSDFDAVLDVNVKAAYFLSQQMAAHLKARGAAGSIVHISSQMAHIGGMDRSIYAASKHALEGMVKSMATEWGRDGIRINTIAPTFIRTALTESTFANPARRAWMEEKIKLGRVGEVADIMGAVIYLASEASALVTGTSLRVDGGWTAA